MSSFLLRKRKILLHLSVFSLTFLCSTLLIGDVHAALPIFGKESLDLPKINQNDGKTTIDMISFLVTRIINYIKILLEAIAVGYIVLVGMDMIINMANEDMIKKKQNTFLYALFGFIIINIGDLALSLFNPRNTGGSFVDQSKFLQLLDLIINLIKFSMSTVAFVLIVMTGFAIISPRSTDISKERKHLTGIVVGLFIIVVADLVQKVFIPSGYDAKLSAVGANGPTSAERGTELILNISGALLYVMGPIALFFMILSGFYYITSNGDAARLAKAKNVAVGTMMAVIIAYSAYALVSEVIRNAIFA